MAESASNITQLLHNLNGGDQHAAEELLPLLYSELRAIAGSHFARQSPGHTLQPTALVHEAYLKLMRNEDVAWEGKSHFLAVAARAMRQILINHARDKKAAKRGGGAKRITIDEGLTPSGSEAGKELDLIALDEALTKLGELNERQARVVELRFFAGLTIAQTAHVLEVGTTTVEDDWAFARAWLARELRGE